MIKNIQKYILLHSPLVWNTRFIPMLFILLLAHIVFFGIGYFTANTDFSMDYRYYSAGESVGLIYFSAVIAVILLFIGWLAFYMRNNAFRLFYPFNTFHLFAEFLIIFFISTLICFLPLTLTYGNMNRWRSIADREEVENILMLLAKTEVIAPQVMDLYRYDYEDNEMILIPKNMIIDRNNINIDDYNISYTNAGYIKFNGYTGRSILYFNTNYGDPYYSFHGQYRKYLSDRYDYSQKEVISWLKNNHKENIISTIDSFLELHQKHNLETNMDRIKWMDMIYKPPFYPVSEHNLIYHNSHNGPSFKPYVEFSKLENNYIHILRCYIDKEELVELSLICSIVGLLACVLIFSFRVTNLKSWITALITSGIIIFASTILILLITEDMYARQDNFMLLFSIFWIAAFIILLVYFIGKLIISGSKGFSQAPLNILIWLIPFIFPLSILTYALIKSRENYYELPDEKLILMMNIPITIISMLFICIIIRKWKNLPEE